MGLRGRGRLTNKYERTKIITAIENSKSSGARQSSVCAALGFCARTLQRWKLSVNNEDGRINNSTIPANKLSEFEVQRILNISIEDRFSNLPPKKIVPKLADEGIYIASESSFYRILKAANQLKHRSKSRASRNIIKPKNWWQLRQTKYIHGI